MPDQAYNDDDLVYVDPESRSVVGSVQFSDSGSPQSLPYDKKGGKETWRKCYPWGTYRSMKGAFRIEGKRVQEESAATLDDVIPLLLSDSL
jgi:hypothetical protein